MSPKNNYSLIGICNNPQTDNTLIKYLGIMVGHVTNPKTYNYISNTLSMYSAVMSSFQV